MCDEMVFFVLGMKWVCKCYGYVIMLYTFTRILAFFFFFFFFFNWDEMGSLSMTEKGFRYEMCNECVMKFILFE